MRVHIGRIKGEKGASLDFEFHESLPLPLTEERPQTVPVDVNGSVMNTSPGYLVHGRVQAEVPLRCDRCLNDYIESVDVDFDEPFYPKGSEPDHLPEESEEEGLDLNEIEPDWTTFEGDAFDIEEIVREHLILALPAKALCEENCKGICSLCGQNKNLGECQCREDRTDPRWAALADLVNSDE